MRILDYFRTAAAVSLLVAAPVSHAMDMVVSSEVAASHWKTRYMNEFAEKVKAATKGEIEVKVYPASQLFNDQDALAALGTGSVHMVWPVAVRLETVAPSLGFINLPFGLTDEQMANPCYADKLTALISDQVEPRQLEVLSLLRTADLMFIFKDRDVQHLDGLKGTKLRVTGGRVFLDMIRNLGASPVSMAASEMSTALSQGAIDGVFTSPAGWAEMIGMTGKYAYHVPSLALATYAVVVDKSWMDQLSEKNRNVIVDTIKEITAKQWKEAREDDAKLVKEMQEKGAAYHVASDADIALAHEMADPGVKSFDKKYPEIVKKAASIASTCGLRK